MNNQDIRTAMLIGDAGVKKLKSSSIAVFGVGGVGSFAAEALARAGIGRLDLFDDDTVSESNINRQLIALHSTVGRQKTEVMKERIADINPSAEVNAVNCFYSPENADDYDLTEYDFIVDAIDTVTSKILLITRAYDAGVPIISSMGTGNKLHPELLEIDDIYKTSVCPLARVMRRELKARGIERLPALYSREIPRSPLNFENVADTGAHKKRAVPASISFVPSAAGLIIAGYVIRELIKNLPCS